MHPILSVAADVAKSAIDAVAEVVDAVTAAPNPDAKYDEENKENAVAKRARQNYKRLRDRRHGGYDASYKSIWCVRSENPDRHAPVAE